MNRRLFLKYANLAGLSATLARSSFRADAETAGGSKKTATPKTSAETLLLKDYRPVSIYKVPVTHIERAKYPVIDMHSHPYAKTDGEIKIWLKNMDAANVEKTLILRMTTGE